MRQMSTMTHSAAIKWLSKITSDPKNETGNRCRWRMCVRCLPCAIRWLSNGQWAINVPTNDLKNETRNRCRWRSSLRTILDWDQKKFENLSNFEKDYSLKHPYSLRRVAFGELQFRRLACRPYNEPSTYQGLYQEV